LIIVGEHVGVVLLGTEESDNPLAEHGYENISTYQEISQPTVELLRRLALIQANTE